MEGGNAQHGSDFHDSILFISSEHETGHDQRRYMGRPSTIMNEDDYDYAIEIRPDDDYRKVALNASHIREFEDLGLVLSPPKVDRMHESIHAKVSHATSNGGNGIVDSLNKYKSVGVSYISSIFTSPSGSHQSQSPAQSQFSSSPKGRSRKTKAKDFTKYDNNSDSSDEDGANSPNPGLEAGLSVDVKSMHISADDVPADFIPTNTFMSRMGMLKQQKAWVEKARRRSSMSYMMKYNISDKSVHDKFLIYMFNGVHVRRHQAYRTSEMVCISSKDGGKEIMWNKASPKDLLNQRRRDGVHVDGTTNSVYAATHDSNGCSYCIQFCGCGDDLLTGNAYNSINGAGRQTVNMINEGDERNYAGKGGPAYNLGFQRSGNFLDFDIIAVHAACCEDPTYQGGVLGTEAFRNSKDLHNSNLSFSIILRSQYSHQGFITLDIECETEESYYILFRGFRLLREEALIRKYREKLEADALAVASGPADKSYSARDTISQAWEALKDKAMKPPKSEDPVDVLFAPSNSFDPLRYIIVGGGLLDESKSKSSDDANEGSGLIPPAQFLGWNTAGTQIWARLKMAGLEVKCVYSWDLKRIILKIRCPQWRLEEMAEHMHLKLKNKDGSMKRFKVSRRDTFVQYGSQDTLFRSSERQQIIDFIIRSKIKEGGAELDENTELGSHIVQRFPLHMISRLQDIRHGWVTFWKVSRLSNSNRLVSSLNSTEKTNFSSNVSGKHASNRAQAAALGIDLELGVDVSLVAAPWSPFSVPIAVTYRNLIDGIENFMIGLLQQPLDHIAEYYGEDIAFYFAYLAYYTRWLIIPSIFGTGVFLVQVQSQRLDHWLCIPYAVLVMLWACFMLAFWRQKSSLLAYRWGVLEYEVEETERPQFHGHYEYDDSSGEVRKVYSPWKRLMKYMITLPVITAATIGMLLIMSCVFSTQDKLYVDFAQGKELNYYPQFGLLFGDFGGDTGIKNPNPSAYTEPTPHSNFMLSSVNSSQTSGDRQPWSMKITAADVENANFWTVTFLYPCIYGVIVNIMAILFEILAISLNNFENHRTQTVYMNRLILKVFSFQFITVFTSLYYYAFFMRNREGAFLRMAVTIFSLMTVGQWWQAIVDVFTPALYHRIMLYKMKVNISTVNRKLYGAKEFVEFGFDPNSGSTGGVGSDVSKEKLDEWKEKIDRRANFLEDARSRCWEEAIQMRYTTFSDYTNLVMQLGFVLLFSLVFPLAPLIACINNIILIRLGAYKICYARQRPIAQKVGGLGVWEDVLQIMSVVGILTNCGIMGYTSTTLRDLLMEVGDTALVAILFSFEHLVLFFKYWLHKSVPRVPPSVQRAQARERRSVLNRKKKVNKYQPNGSINSKYDGNDGSSIKADDNEQKYADMYFENMEQDISKSDNNPNEPEILAHDDRLRVNTRRNRKDKSKNDGNLRQQKDADIEPEMEKFVSVKGKSQKKFQQVDDFFSTNYFDSFENMSSPDLSPEPSSYSYNGNNSPTYSHQMYDNNSNDYSYDNHNVGDDRNYSVFVEDEAVNSRFENNSRSGSPKTVRFSMGHSIVEFEKQTEPSGDADSSDNDDSDDLDDDHDDDRSIKDMQKTVHSNVSDQTVTSILKKQQPSITDFDNVPFPLPRRADNSKPIQDKKNNGGKNGFFPIPNHKKQSQMNLQSLGAAQLQPGASSPTPRGNGNNRKHGDGGHGNTFMSSMMTNITEKLDVLERSYKNREDNLENCSQNSRYYQQSNDSNSPNRQQSPNNTPRKRNVNHGSNSPNSSPNPNFNSANSKNGRANAQMGTTSPMKKPL